jgi:hypothetical protein
LVKEAQEALGHADSRTTMAIYQHALPGGRKPPRRGWTYIWGGSPVALTSG